MSSQQILQPGQNCWLLARADRAAVLIDGSAYFAALEAALGSARRSVLIIGWDFDGRISLRPDRQDGANPPLGIFLRSLVDRRPELKVRILVWSVAVVHAPGSPTDLLFGAAWQQHPGIQIKLDTEHPLYAAHHQKIVCIDDQIAFVGGTDLTVRRWDTPSHQPDNPYRRDPDGTPYGPVHDLQMVVDGEAALQVSEVARGRWRTATREDVEAVQARGDVWPMEIEPDFRNVKVAVARTAPAWKGQPAVREGAALTLESIRAAQRSLYLEAQYLTAAKVGEALVEVLQRPKGPEVVIVVTRRSRGVVERLVMGRNRDRLLRRLRRADLHRRLRVFYPVVPRAGGVEEVLVHAKLAIIDDRLLRIGSSNLNNRSVGLDTECDLAIEGDDAEVQRRITSVCARLLAEHLCTTPEVVERCLAETGSLIRTIERLNVHSRCIRAYEIDGSVGPSWPVWATAVFDPERPFGLMRPVMRALLPLLRPFLSRRP